MENLLEKIFVDTNGRFYKSDHILNPSDSTIENPSQTMIDACDGNKRSEVEVQHRMFLLSQGLPLDPIKETQNV